MLLTHFVIRLKCSITNLRVPLHTRFMLLATVLVEMNYLITLFKHIREVSQRIFRVSQLKEYLIAFK